ALVLVFNAIGLLRQHLPADVRIHGIVTKGGDAPNIIPDPYTGGNAGTTVVYAIPLAIGAIVLIRVCRKAGRTLDYRESPKEW
ncbi:MAG: hypothetical protein IIT35_06715, partial [Oscillospiraceae bacterium]|nr:hypothetical protein [Oscillospiraceae bacterium]